MQPFLKWAGGKRWLAKEIAARLPSTYGRYIEPFLGSGAVFFELEPERAILSDSNNILITVYQTIKTYPDDVFDLLRNFHRQHSKDFYYYQRNRSYDDTISRAAQFVYLNRTCWNGLYRVNKKDVFNVPIGTKSNVIFPTDDFRRISKVLSGADLKACDFELTIDRAKSGDVVYVDPPYTVKHNMNGFVKYNQKIFSWQDQIRLRDSLLPAARFVASFDQPTSLRRPTSCFRAPCPSLSASSA